MTSLGRALATLTAALHPALTRELADFEAARAALVATRPVPTTVAVVGLTPGEGRTSVAALLALAVSGWSDRRVMVLDAVAAPGARRDPVNGVASVQDVAGRSVTALLQGDVGQGRISSLVEDPKRTGLPDLADGSGASPRGQSSVLAAKARDVVRRARVRAAITPGAVVPVLSLPAGRLAGGFPPQDLERAVARLRYRADLVVIDTPAGPLAPVLHGALRHADHLVVVVRGDGDLDARLRSVHRWATTAPGGSPDRGITAVVLRRGLRPVKFTDPGFPVVVLGRDEGLRRRSPDRISRRSITTGLFLAAGISAAAERSQGRPPVHSPDSAAAGPGRPMGSPPHLGQLREPLPQR